MKKVLVIGGSYFAGRVFIEEYLTCKDAEIHVFNRGRSPLGMAGVTEHQGDREDAEQIRDIIPNESWDAVVDFCAYNPDHIELLLNNIRGSIQHYILISTTSVYKDGLEHPADESFQVLTGPQPELGRFSDYGYDKLRAELSLKENCARKGIEYTILRPAIIYGFYNYTDRERYFFDAVINETPIIVPEANHALYSFVWVVDVAHLIINSICNESTYSQAFNLSAQQLVSYESMAAVLSKISGKTPQIEYRSIDDIVAMKIPLPYPPGENLIYDGSEISCLLDFNYTPLDAGMHKSFDYYKQVLNSRRNG